MHGLGNWRSHSHHRTRYPAWSSACCRFQPRQSNRSFNWDFKCIKVQLLGLLGFWLPEPFPSFPFIKDMNWVPETRSVKVLMASVFPVSPCLSSRCSRKQTAALWANETDFTLLPHAATWTKTFELNGRIHWDSPKFDQQNKIMLLEPYQLKHEWETNAWNSWFVCENPMLAETQQHLMAFRGDRGTFLEILFTSHGSFIQQ